MSLERFGHFLNSLFSATVLFATIECNKFVTFIQIPDYLSEERVYTRVHPVSNSMDCLKVCETKVWELKIVC